MLGFLEQAWMWAQTALSIWWYVILPVLVLAGCYVYIKRSPHVNCGIAREYEEEGNLEQALQYYRRAAHYGEGRPEGKPAQARIPEILEKIHERNRDVDPEEVERDVAAAIREVRGTTGTDVA